MLAKDFLTIGIFALFGIAFIVITLIASWAVRPHRPSDAKLSTYECGEIPIGPAWTQFRVGYYIYAIIFLIFDVEAIFLYPWAAQLLGFKNNHAMMVMGFVDMVIFVAVLSVGLAWAWKKGVLEWK
ncbi:MAG: NADH-quinone oxidoreductase subunit A [Armatimonadetes bacterium]|nr:NADH-quinone oxidoreductase subunit A [Armatimonadota bacterium]